MAKTLQNSSNLSGATQRYLLFEMVFQGTRLHVAFDGRFNFFYLGGLPRHIFVMPMGYGVVWFHLELIISVFGVVPRCIAAIQDIQV